MKRKIAQSQKINDFIKENHIPRHPVQSMPIETVCNIQFKKKWKEVCKESGLNEGELAYVAITAINRALYSLNVSKTVFESITKQYELEPTDEEKKRIEAERAAKDKSDSEKLNEFLNTILNTNNAGIRRKLVSIKQFVSKLEKENA